VAVGRGGLSLGTIERVPERPDPPDDPVARRSGRDAGLRWLLEDANEVERAELAATFAGGGFAIEVTPPRFPTLAPALGEHGPQRGGGVDFSASSWLSGFRDAVIEQLAEPD